MSELIERAMQLAKELDDKYGPLGISRTVFVKQLHAAGLLSAPAEVVALPSDQFAELMLIATEIRQAGLELNRSFVEQECGQDEQPMFETAWATRAASIMLKHFDARLKELATLRAEVERLRNKLQPFADCIRYDNGDVTWQDNATVENYLDAFFALRKYLNPTPEAKS